MNLKYISFDIYDTLIRRIIPEKEIYEVMEKVLEKKYNIKITNFCQKRILAQQLAKKTYGNNYNLKDIYSVFPIEKLTKKELSLIINLEKEFEINCTIPNSVGKELYQKYRKDYNIICITDMYLDKKTITSILKNNGYNIDKIFISCEENMSKRQNNIYNKVLQDLEINRKQILHIGDSKRSDYLNPKLLGIKSKLIKNNIYDSYYYNIGNQVFGPLLYEFCKWINSNIDKDSKLLFVSREGQFIKECFDLMYDNLDTNMIYLSRKSVISGVSSEYLKCNSLSELLKIISLKRNETIGELFNRIGLDTDKYLSELEHINLKLDNLIDKKIDIFFEKNRSQIIRDLQENSKIFSMYIDSVLSKKNILVDIGWKGSMQILLSKYLKIKKSDKKIKGLYLGIMDNCDKNGYLFNKNNNNCQNILNYSGLLEIIMMPNYGSVIGYRKNANVIEPVFAKSEFTYDSLNIIKKIQNGILDFIKKMKLFDNQIDYEKKLIINKLNNFALNPNLKDIQYFKKLEFYDNEKLYYLIEPIKIKNIKESFINTKWKTAFLKRMFRINLPYGSIVSFLRKKVDKKCLK